MNNISTEIANTTFLLEDKWKQWAAVITGLDNWTGLLGSPKLDLMIEEFPTAIYASTKTW